MDLHALMRLNRGGFKVLRTDRRGTEGCSSLGKQSDRLKIFIHHFPPTVGHRSRGYRSRSRSIQKVHVQVQRVQIQILRVWKVQIQVRKVQKALWSCAFRAVFTLRIPSSFALGPFSYYAGCLAEDEDARDCSQEASKSHIV